MQPEKRRVLVATATFNERGNIDKLCADILGLAIEPDLLVVDDNSSDGTGERLDELASRTPRLIAIHRPRKMGLGSAHMLGMNYAIRHGYDVLVTMDADFSHDPAAVPKLIDALDTADFVIGSRYMPGGTSDYEGYRHFVSVSANRLARLLLGIPTHEFTTSFRAFRTEVLAGLDLGAIRSQGYSFFMESLWLIARSGHRVAEVPIHFSDRVHGESKIPRYEIVSGGLKLLSLFASGLFRRRQPRTEHRDPGPCPICGNSLRMMLYPAAGEQPATGESEAYRCTSIEHRSRPEVVRCLACGIETAGEESFRRSHENEYESVVDEEYLDNDWVKQKTFKRLASQVAPYAQTSKVLEVGAYCGLFMDVARDKGWNISGIEPSHWASDIARSKGHEIVQGALSSAADRVNGPFDMIVSWDVVEHLEDPVRDLAVMRSKMASEGVLCLTTINKDGWFARLTGRRWPWIMHMHLYYFTSKTLGDVLRRAGFSLVEEMPYHHYASLRYLAAKAAALMPPGVSALALLVSRVIPARLAIPVYLGDVKLYIARPAAASTGQETTREPGLESADRK
jgi:dolichol-phosphate mannosyltransferase